MAVANDPSPATSTWLADSGCNTHVTPDATNLVLNSNYNEEDAITVANGQGLPVAQAGFGILPTPKRTFQLQNLCCVPDLSTNLLSVSQCCADNNCTFTFDVIGSLFRTRQRDNFYTRAGVAMVFIPFMLASTHKAHQVLICYLLQNLSVLLCLSLGYLLLFCGILVLATPPLEF